MAVWSGNVQKVFIPDATHNNIQQFPETEVAIKKFLQ
jgi:hypothetical protein